MFSKLSQYSEIFNIYRDKRVIAVFLMGISQGLPWVMIGSSLTLWLKEADISRSDIGFAGLIFGVYSINFFWSPLVDQVRLPGFARLGQRKNWILACQAVICIACLLMSIGNPEVSAKALVLTALIIASFSATQDISIDAYRIDSFARSETKHISAAAAAATAGWWTGYAGIGYVPLALSDLDWSWPQLYLLMAAVMALVAYTTVQLPQPRFSNPDTRHEHYSSYLISIRNAQQKRRYQLMILLGLPLALCIWAIAGSPGLPEIYSKRPEYPLEIIALVLLLAFAIGRSLAALEREANHATLPTRAARATPGDKVLAWLLSSVVEPIKEFLTRNPIKLALAIIGFVFLFKVGEAFLGRMSIVFYKEIGYSNTDIANYSKMLTWWLTVVFSLIGGLVNARFGIVKGLMVSGCAMAGSNLMFAWIAKVGPDINLYIATIIVDGFAQAWSTVAFVSFISMLCSHSFSATQYALLASLASLGRNTLASASGLVVDWLDGNWSLFFVLTTLMVIPSLMLLFSIRGSINEMEKEKGGSKGLPTN